MKRVVIDTSAVCTREALHDVFKQQLELPDYYGKNLDALWDCLTGWVDLPLTVEWHGFHEARSRIGDYADRALETFRQAQNELDDFSVVVVERDSALG